MRTLVVEDSSSMRSLLSELLSERDYEVVAVETAEAALKEHHLKPFDLMLVDWTLPGISGLDLCRLVRQRPGGEDVVILVITGRNRPDDLNAVLDAGASDYLSKPIDPEILRTRLLVAERAVRDVEERKKMQSRLVFADRMASVGTLAAGVAHELNNPLMYVLSNLRLMREELQSEGKKEWVNGLAEQIDEAIHGAKRMRHIVRDLKTFSRADKERSTVVDLGSVFESSLSLCWNEIRHRATLIKDFEKTPAVEANESRLGQVFLNLLINAAQAMPERGVDENEITLRMRTDSEGWAVVEVSDNGMGIPEDVLGRIFDPFYTTKDVSEGTGLGLAICNNIISDAGGQIAVESKPSVGTTFQVRLPPSSRPVTPKRRTIAPPAMTNGAAKARVVVVDDEPLVGRSIRRALRNHDVQVFSSGREAIETLCTGDGVDIVFCDIMMPEVSGMEVFGTVQERRPDVASRFVFMTGGAFTPKAKQFLEETPLICLEKPFDLGQIRDLVKERTEASG